MRRNSCVWPPSNIMAGFFAPALAHWPLWPRVDVLPMPEPTPRPTRFFGVRFVTPWLTLVRSMLQSHSSQGRHLLARPQLHQAVDGSFHQVDRVGAAVNLGQDVPHATDDQHLADARPGFHT